MKYSDVAIETVLTLRLILSLPLRQAEGFLTSLFRIMDIDLPTPDHDFTLVRFPDRYGTSDALSTSCRDRGPPTPNMARIWTLDRLKPTIRAPTP